LYKEYRRKQDIRVKDAQHQSANVRYTYAQQAIRKRQKEIVDEEAERCSRSAMSLALRVGKSIIEARIDAEHARIESYRDNGVTILSGSDEDDNAKDDDGDGDMQKKATAAAAVEAVTKEDNNKDNIPSSRPRPSAAEPTTDSTKFIRGEGSSSLSSATTTTDVVSSTSTTTNDGVNNISSDDGATTVVDAAKISDINNSNSNSNRGPTPHTSAFMDRLREMYDKAAEEKKRKTNTTTSTINNKNNDDDDDDDDDSVWLKHEAAGRALRDRGCCREAVFHYGMAWITCPNTRA
jgi:hypothetical protein